MQRPGGSQHGQGRVKGKSRRKESRRPQGPGAKGRAQEGGDEESRRAEDRDPQDASPQGRDESSAPRPASGEEGGGREGRAEKNRCEEGRRPARRGRRASQTQGAQPPPHDDRPDTPAPQSRPAAPTRRGATRTDLQREPCGGRCRLRRRWSSRLCAVSRPGNRRCVRRAMPGACDQVAVAVHR